MQRIGSRPEKKPTPRKTPKQGFAYAVGGVIAMALVLTFAVLVVTALALSATLLIDALNALAAAL